MSSILNQVQGDEECLKVPYSIIKALTPNGAVVFMEHLRAHSKECRAALKHPCKVYAESTKYQLKKSTICKEFSIPRAVIDAITSELIKLGFIKQVGTDECNIPLWELSVQEVLIMSNGIEKFFINKGYKCFQVPDTNLRERVAGVKPVRKVSNKVLHKKTVEFIEIWNSFDNLKKHSITKSTVNGFYMYEEQLAYIKRLDDKIRSILNGTFYTAFQEIEPVALRSLKVTTAQFRMVAERLNRMATPEYTKNPKMLKQLYIVDAFFRNTPAPIKAEDSPKHKYKYKFPFIHCMLNDPLPLTEAKQYTAVSENPMVVNSVIQMLKDNSKFVHNTNNFNTVVRMVDRATANIKAEANGSSGKIIERLHVHLSKCMGDKIHIDNLYTAVEYKLLPYLRSIYEIRS